MVNFNVGTTFKSAYDDVESAISALVPILKANGLYERKVIYDTETGKYDIRAGYWFHIDGALGAAYIPFLEMDSEKDIPIFDFRIKEVGSISMSGHKWLGAP
jgi:histidine decarboxylase